MAGTMVSNGKAMLVLCLALTLALVSSSPAFAAAGALDTSFDGDGKVVTDFGQTFDSALDVALYPGGKFVVAGIRFGDLGGIDFAIARYNGDGSLDHTFGQDGKVTTAFGNCDAFAFGLAIQPNGKIIAGGSSSAGGECENLDFAVARYNPDGTLDESFDGDGKVTTEFDAASGSAEEGQAVAVSPDGKIVVTGSVSSGGDDIALARYNPDGSLDATFDGDGKVITDFGGSEGASGIAMQPNGRIVVAGLESAGGTTDFALARYNSDGSLDATFDGDGKVVTDFGSAADGSFEDARGGLTVRDGKIVAAGIMSLSGQTDFAVARYNFDGSLDSAFDGDGRVTTDFGGGEAAFDVATEASGRVVAAGVGILNGGFGDFALARYNSDGSLDSTFDGDGKIITDFGGNDVAFGLVIQPDGRIVAAGSGAGDFAVARYLGR